MTNEANVSGRVMSDPIYTHTYGGEMFYRTMLSIERHSGIIDTIPVSISRKQLDAFPVRFGMDIAVHGSLRSRNWHGADGKSHLDVYILSKMIYPGRLHENYIVLDGYICKKPRHRVTDSGKDIADMILAVNRDGGGSDYFPTICWGSNARIAERFEVGNRMLVSGRIQSRDYRKLLDNERIIKTTIELSVNSINCIKEKARLV